ncbi:MAG: cytochrome c peroxidase [Syntrophotaleaceae bacterium]
MNEQSSTTSKPKTFLFFLLLAGTFFAAPCHAVADGRATEYEGSALTTRIYFKPLPEQMPGSQGDTPALVELGRKLFFERGISLNKTQACSDCHLLDGRHAGTDNLPTSPGARGIHGKRNTPTVLNAGFQILQFWDGRAVDLVEQARGPLLHPDEMAMRTEEEVVSRLQGIEDYRSSFARAFPKPGDQITFDHIVQAIAAFERTLVAPARFDRYLKGETGALSEAEKHGLRRFMEVGCVECHSSHPVGGRLLQKFGIYHPYDNESDAGRYEITGREEDRFVFKVPMLRNVTLTAPYFHDGKVSSLPEAIRRMAWMQLDRQLGPTEIEEIVGFLKALETENPGSNRP